MAVTVDPKMDWSKFLSTRDTLGDGFLRIMGYFREDGLKAIASIEEAVRAGAPAPLVLPAHRLKSEAREFGAMGIAELAEQIEFSARDFVEWRQDASGLVEHVVGMRKLFEATLAEIDGEINPLMQRRVAN